MTWRCQSSKLPSHAFCPSTKFPTIFQKSRFRIKSMTFTTIDCSPCPAVIGICQVLRASPTACLPDRPQHRRARPHLSGVHDVVHGAKAIGIEELLPGVGKKKQTTQLHQLMCSHPHSPAVTNQWKPFMSKSEPAGQRDCAGTLKRMLEHKVDDAMSS